MKKIFRTISVISMVLIFSITASAQSYKLSGTDMSVSIEEPRWYVFTRDNIKNNLELNEIGLSYEDMYGILYDNEGYMDAILFYEDGGFTELLIRKSPEQADIANLSDCEDNFVSKLAKEFGKEQGTETYEVYENQYKYVALQYFDESIEVFICEFITVVNKDIYTFTFQSSGMFTDWEYEEFIRIIDSVQFDVDTSIKDTITVGSSNVVQRTGVGAIAGAVTGRILSVAKKLERKKKTEAENILTDNTTTE